MKESLIEIEWPNGKTSFVEPGTSWLASALEAGLRVVGVAFTHPESKLSKADWIVSGLSELSAQNLVDWFCENSSGRQ